MGGGVFDPFGLVVVLLFFGLLAYLAFQRFISYRETLALAEKGLLRVEPEHRNGRSSLRWGIVITALGLAMSLGIYPVGFSVAHSYPLNFGPWMLVGLLPLFFGIALILIRVLTRDEKAKSETRDDAPPVRPVAE